MSLRWASMVYGRSTNVGDDIQSLAVEALLPRVDGHVDRDRLHEVTEPTALVLNGWFAPPACCWPPSDAVRPLFWGFHAADPALLTKAHAPYYRRHAPVGCRDEGTAAGLRALGVDAAVTRCLTLTLERPHVPRDGGVVLVDVPRPLRCFLPWRWRLFARRLSHKGGALHHEHEKKRRLARERLDAYARARLVVTGRLHCALPCIALGTPVVLIVEDPAEPRLGPLRDLLPIWGPADRGRIDFDPPAPDVSALAAVLRERFRARLASLDA